MNSRTSGARAKKVLKVEKTEDTSKEAVKKKTFLREKSLFWVKQDATEKEDQRTIIYKKTPARTQPSILD